MWPFLTGRSHDAVGDGQRGCDREVVPDRAVTGKKRPKKGVTTRVDSAAFNGPALVAGMIAVFPA